MEDRREYQRLALTEPLKGKFGKASVRVIDVSAAGALIQSEKKIKVGQRASLSFTWRKHKLALTAEVVRVDDDRAGIHFMRPSAKLRKMIAESATEVLKAQQANLEGERAKNIIAGDETLTSASAGLRAVAGFVTWTLEENGWRRRRSLLPDQPENGITVSAAEAEDQVELLRKTYENGDAEARRLTRLLAELSVATVRSGP